jgi:hypothetical protein
MAPPSRRKEQKRSLEALWDASARARAAERRRQVLDEWIDYHAQRAAGLRREAARHIVLREECKQLLKDMSA